MGHPNPLISVILPAYNCAQFLPQAIDSILSQTLSDFELLIVYDESRDATLELIRQYVTADQRVKLILGKKERLVGALNLGISVAQGEYIARMDADDISEPERFARQVSYMQSHHLDLCGCDMVMINEIGRPLEAVVMPSTPELITITLACTVPFAHGSVMMHKAFLDQHQLRYQSGSAAEDYDFWCNAYHLGGRFGNVSQFLFKYRHLANSLSKVHAKVVGKNTSALRRSFVRQNCAAVQKAITHLLDHQSNLSMRESVFLVLAAYLLSLQTKSGLAFRVMKQSSVKANVIAIAKVLSGF